MNYLFWILIFILGASLGSFVNVVSLRHGTGLSAFSGRSKCMSCNKNLKWYETVPFIGFLFLRGKCSKCKSKISPRYFFVELLMGVVMVSVVFRQINLWHIYSSMNFGFLYASIIFVYYIISFCILLAIVLYDIDHKIIIDKLVYSFIILSFLKMFLFFYLNHFIFIKSDYLDILSPIILSLPIIFLWFISQGRWIGFGDAKLMFGIGFMLGFVRGISVFILAFWIGAIWGIIMIIYSKYLIKKGQIGLKSAVPFAPFIVLALFICFIFNVDILGISLLLN